MRWHCLLYVKQRKTLREDFDQIRRSHGSQNFLVHHGGKLESINESLCLVFTRNLPVKHCNVFGVSLPAALGLFQLQVNGSLEEPITIKAFSKYWWSRCQSCTTSTWVIFITCCQSAGWTLPKILENSDWIAIVHVSHTLLHPNGHDSSGYCVASELNNLQLLSRIYQVSKISLLHVRCSATKNLGNAIYPSPTCRTCAPNVIACMTFLHLNCLAFNNLTGPFPWGDRLRSNTSFNRPYSRKEWPGNVASGSISWY